MIYQNRYRTYSHGMVYTAFQRDYIVEENQKVEIFYKDEMEKAEAYFKELEQAQRQEQ